MSFVQPKHRLPLELAISLYDSVIEERDGFVLVYRSVRVGIWMKDNTAIVGCKGTTPNHAKDIRDDIKLATSKNRCDLSLVQEVDELLQELKATYIIFAGHSLGGAAAMCLASKYSNSIAIVYNAAAPPTNPVLSGPGPQRAVHYHVMGDGISSHMSPNAASIIRVHIPGPMWGYAFPHAVDRLYDTKWSYVSVDTEQDSWKRSGANIVKYFGILKHVVAKQFVCSHPIPGSNRPCSWKDRLNPF